MKLSILNLQVQDECQTARSICNKVSKPSENTKKLLSKLFPGSGSKTLPTKRPFDPSDMSIAEQSRAKKKAAIPKLCKPRTISFVLLDAPLPVVPKGKARKALEEGGRVKKVQIRRSMTASAIREVICNTFSSLPCAKTAKFMSCGKDNHLTVASNQDLGGDDVVKLAGSGSVYMCEVHTVLAVTILTGSLIIINFTVPES